MRFKASIRTIIYCFELKKNIETTHQSMRLTVGYASDESSKADQNRSNPPTQSAAGASRPKAGPAPIFGKK